MLNYESCQLCPRLCGVNREAGQLGFCGAGSVARAARAALHMWEEPPLVCECGSGTVFFSHCNLGCVYCQNRTLARGDVGWSLTAEDLAEGFLRLQSKGACNINLVTATHFAPTVIEAVALARRGEGGLGGLGNGGQGCLGEGGRASLGEGGLKLPVVWNSSGYERPELIRELRDSGTVDIFLFDYKYGTAEMGARYSAAPDYAAVALQAIEAAKAPSTWDNFNGQRRMTHGVIVRHMLLPQALDHSKAALRQLFERFGNGVEYSIMNQYTPLHTEEFAGKFPELCHPVSTEDYEELLNFADALGMDYFWQEEPACAESFIPDWNGEGLGYN